MMKLIIFLALFVLAVSGAAVVYGTVAQPHLLSTFNGLRLKCARGVERWHNYTWEYDANYDDSLPTPPIKYSPKATKMFQLKWNATLATAAAKRLNTLSGGKMTGIVPTNVGEISYGVAYGVAPNTTSVTQISLFFVDNAWGQWGALFDWQGLDTFAYSTANNQYVMYQLIAGPTTQIGCAYLNITASSQYATVCQFYPKALAAKVNVYLSGTKTCSACPTATASCIAATGLCNVKAALSENKQ